MQASHALALRRPVADRIRAFASVRCLTIIGFAALIVILAAIVTVSVVLSRQHIANIQSIDKHTNSRNAVTSIELSGATGMAAVAYYVATGNSFARPAVLDAITAIQKDLDRTQTAFTEEGDAADLADLAGLRPAVAQLITDWQMVLAAGDGGDRAAEVASLQASVVSISTVLPAFDAIMQREALEEGAARGESSDTAGFTFWALVASGLLGVVLAAAAAYYVIRSVLRPISALREAADRVSAGDLGARAPEAGPRELATVGIAFNRMTEALLDASKRREMEAERERIYARLKEREARLSAFASTHRLETIRHMAYYDALTGIPNRTLFRDRFFMAAANARRIGETFTVMSLDLDRFKVINDTLGHASGDEILRQAAARLAGIHRESDTVARVGGDEFLLLLRGCSSVSDAETAAHKILQAFDLPFSADGQEIRLTTSIGISRYPVDGGDMEAVIRNADTAMYYAKESGRHTYRMYSQAANGQAEDRMTIESELRRAIPGQLEVWYQPQLDLRDSTIMTVEALVRWNHPQRGIILPGEFISVAEDSGLIVPLGEYVLREACATVRGWTEAGLPPVRVAVNISMRQFSQPDLVGMVARILARTGLEPSYLELEITESTAARDMKRTVELLRQLEAMGVRISIDDFGTGYSAFGSLRQLPLHALKIDRSLICDIEHDPGDAAIAANIISLAHNLGLEVIAEGVETEQQLNFLKQEGCDAYQGYLCARPMTAGQMAGILAQGRGECRCQGSPEDPARTASATPDRSA